MTFFYAVELKNGNRVVGLVKACGIKHAGTKVERLYDAAGWQSWEVSKKISDHADELIAAGFAVTQ